jgi:hypothetical protein
MRRDHHHFDLERSQAARAKIQNIHLSALGFTDPTLATQ